MDLTDRFTTAAERAGARVVRCPRRSALLDYLAAEAAGSILLPNFAVGSRLNLAAGLRQRNCPVITEDFRRLAPRADSGVTGANFALADTGTVVLDSTDEPLRLASTLPLRHFVILDPRKILADSMAAVGVLGQLQKHPDPGFTAFITGPSRTADIERVLTIGVHGPAQLHILLLQGVSEDLLES